MDRQLVETSSVVLDSRHTSAPFMLVELSLAADRANLISDDGSEPLEAQRMSCPRCQHTFPTGFYCIACGYVPTEPRK
jgi:hypothetical protein